MTAPVFGQDRTRLIGSLLFLFLFSDWRNPGISIDYYYLKWYNFSDTMQSVLGSTSRQLTPFLIKHRRRQLFLISLIILFAAGISFFGYQLGTGYSEQKAFEKASSLTAETILSAWATRDYDFIYRETAVALSARPVDPFLLTFNGFSSFYIGTRTNDGELRIIMMREAVTSLRKALLIGIENLTPQIHYVIGKASFYRGREFYDDCIRYLEAAFKLGYQSSDIWEYLALAHRDLDQLSASLDAFSRAIAANPQSMPLLLAAAKVSQQAGDRNQAELFANKVWVSSQDQFLHEQAGFVLANLLIEQQKYQETLEIINTIKKINPESADAWYFEGLVYQKLNDLIRARAAWRRAVAIDPMHIESRNKLNERL